MKLKNLLVGTATLISAVALAEGTVTVEKVQGSKAIVKFEGMTPKAGESYDLGGGGGGGGGGNGSRAMYIALNSNLISKTFSGPMTFSLSGTPGWNMGQFEVGVPITFTYAHATGANVMTMSGGLKPEFNFSDNNAGTMMVPYVGALFSFTLVNTTGLGSAKAMSFGGELGLKYFLNDQVAVTAALSFTMTKAIGGATAKTIGLPVGIRAYF
jgi:hypothetical protein